MKWAMSRKKGTECNFYQTVSFYVFCIYIILRLICDTLSKIAVKISFPRGPQHDVYASGAFSVSVTSWYLHKDMQNFASVILLLNYVTATLHDAAQIMIKVTVCCTVKVSYM